MSKILVIDDDNDMCMLLNRFLTRKGYTVEVTLTGKAALEYVKKERPDLILCDFRLEDMTGTELLGKIRESNIDTPVIIITGYSDVKDAVDVMKLGAYDYVTKPLFPDEILLTIKNALSRNQKESKTSLADTTKNGEGISGTKTVFDNEYIMGDSPEFANIIKQIELVAPTNYSVIIHGESGSGKEAIARQIHLRSKRSDKPFVAIDCGALSRELAGSELFGHEKGAFTGALNQKIGSMEIANEGTIFLDEISNLSYEIQVSLLRVVQERKIRRVGGTKDIDLDVRIIIASNENLWQHARTGKFREDLYHRFNEFSIEVPPLRARKNDIMLFARHFLRQTNAELGKNVKGFSRQVEDIFNGYIWYGNLRELKNVVKRATLLTDTDFIEVQSLPFEITNFHRLQFDDPIHVDENKNNVANAATDHSVSFETMLKNANIDAEYEVILNALKHANYNKSKAAKLLNIDRKTLYNKMKQFKDINMK